MRFSDDQKKIAILLLNEPKTEEQLNKQLNISFDKLMMELKAMVKLNVVTKEGYPTKYKLAQNIIDEVQKRKEISRKTSRRKKQINQVLSKYFSISHLVTCNLYSSYSAFLAAI